MEEQERELCEKNLKIECSMIMESFSFLLQRYIKGTVDIIELNA